VYKRKRFMSKDAIERAEKVIDKTIINQLSQKQAALILSTVTI
jgi:uncharacterized protein (DUF1778 family)